jgi:Cysteine-rich secretory protein family
MPLRPLPAFASVLLLAGCSVAVAPPGGRSSNALLPEHLAAIDRILTDLHNRERVQVGAPPLAWDPRLAAAAAAYGPTLAARGTLVHSPLATRPDQGENLWKGTHGHYSLASMFEAWAGEKWVFRPGTFPWVGPTGRLDDVGHYTQIIWRRTTHVGCAVHQTPAWDYLICRYAPAGNVIGQRVP